MSNNSDQGGELKMHTEQIRKIPVCNILGVHVAAINMDMLMQFTREHAEELSGEYICVSNVHTTVTA